MTKTKITFLGNHENQDRCHLHLDPGLKDPHWHTLAFFWLCQPFWQLHRHGNQNVASLWLSKKTHLHAKKPAPATPAAHSCALRKAVTM